MQKLSARHGGRLIADLHKAKGQPIRVLTHCNAGWLATVDWGTALAPIYDAHENGVPVHVLVIPKAAARNILDIHPKAPGHVQVIPKEHIRWEWDVPNAGEYFELVNKIAHAQRKHCPPR